MKCPLEILCAVLLFGAAVVNGEEKPETVTSAPPAVPASKSEGTPLTPPLETGGVELGDSTVKPGSNGKSETLIQSGNRVIYQKNGASTFRSAPKGETPQYVNDSEGRVRQVAPVQKAKPIVSVPNPSSSSSSQPSQRESRPSPIPRQERPSGSSMPRSPFLRPNPLRR